MGTKEGVYTISIVEYIYVVISKVVWKGHEAFAVSELVLNHREDQVQTQSLVTKAFYGHHASGLHYKKTKTHDCKLPSMYTDYTETYMHSTFPSFANVSRLIDRVSCN